MKYPGGYVIVDFKGLTLELDAEQQILDPEIAKRLVDAFDTGKPIYITNIEDIYENRLDGVLDTSLLVSGDHALIQYPNSEGKTFSYLSIQFSYDPVSATIELKSIQ